MSPSTEALNEDIYEESVYAKVGALFKEARVSRNISIQHACQELHIRSVYITAIEQGNLSALPGHVYKVGFIKTYAKFLNLDATQILKDLGLQEEITPDYSSFNYSIPVEQQKKPNLKVILAATTLLFIGGGILYVSNNSYQHAEDIVVLKDLQEDTTLSSTSAPPDNASLSSLLVPNNDIGIANIATSASTYHPDSASSAETENPGIQVVAIKDAWVQIVDENGKAIFVRLMRTGETYSVPATGKYQLNTGNGAGIKLMVGDKSTPPLGENGKVIRGISLAKENISSLLKE
ncbi:helix-turn-helix domain-containing protein [Candidatus Odyssella thessalonicensis]|uniref:helix-turn-helix domain-containing protein n=1 Tax=Candidatus Odyssella thessalonicensis TaxID=84647 RepID=UPI000225BAF2|nr:RodZ domain-containing protein [Candidatus Odyssella thessalonicensis]